MQSGRMSRWLHTVSLNNYGIILMAIGCVILYSVIESAVHAFILHETNFVRQLFAPDPHEVWMRSLVGIVLIPFVVYLYVAAARRKRTEEALRTSQESFGGLLEATVDGILLADAETRRFLMANRAICQMTGYSPEELQEMGVDDIHPEEDLDYVLEQFEKQAAGIIQLAPELPVRRKDGSVFYADINTGPLILDGQPHLLGSFRDVTERKQAEERIAHLNQVLQAIRDVNQLIASERDRDRLLQGACDALTSTRGYHSAWIALFDKDDRFVLGFESGLGDSFTPFREVLQRGELPHCMRDVLGKSGVIAVEHRTTSCGDCPLAEVYPGAAAMAVRLEHAGEVYGLVSVSLPVEMANSEEEQSLLAELSSDLALGLNAMVLRAERKQAEEMVQAERDRAQNYLDIAGSMLAVVDADEKVSLLNKRGCEILGYGEEEIIGQNWFDILVPENIREQVRAVFGQLMDGDVEPLAHYENSLLTKSGEQRLIAFHNTVLRDADGNIHAVLLSGEDITERKQTEEALRQAQKMEAVGTLSAGIAHDFNNILQTVIGRVQFMLTFSGLDTQATKNLEEVASTAFRGASLVKRLLVFSRHIGVHKHTLNLEMTIEDVRHILERTASRLVTIETDVAHDLWL